MKSIQELETLSKNLLIIKWLWKAIHGKYEINHGMTDGFYAYMRIGKQRYTRACLMESISINKVEIDNLTKKLGIGQVYFQGKGEIKIPNSTMDQKMWEYIRSDEIESKESTKVSDGELQSSATAN